MCRLARRLLRLIALAPTGPRAAAPPRKIFSQTRRWVLGGRTRPQGEWDLGQGGPIILRGEGTAGHRSGSQGAEAPKNSPPPLHPSITQPPPGPRCRAPIIAILRPDGPWPRSTCRRRTSRPRATSTAPAPCSAATTTSRSPHAPASALPTPGPPPPAPHSRPQHRPAIRFCHEGLRIDGVPPLWLHSFPSVHSQLFFSDFFPLGRGGSNICSIIPNLQVGGGSEVTRWRNFI